MTFKINDKEQVELKYSFRSNVYFEQIQGKSIDPAHFTANDLLTLCYCIVISSLQKEKRPIISMLDCMDAIDDYNGGESFFINFSEWYRHELEVMYENIKPQEKEEKKTKKKKN